MFHLTKKQIKDIIKRYTRARIYITVDGEEIYRNTSDHNTMLLIKEYIKRFNEKFVPRSTGLQTGVEIIDMAVWSSKMKHLFQTEEDSSDLYFAFYYTSKKEEHVEIALQIKEPRSFFKEGLLHHYLRFCLLQVHKMHPIMKFKGAYFDYLHMTDPVGYQLFKPTDPLITQLFTTKAIALKIKRKQEKILAEQEIEQKPPEDPICVIVKFGVLAFVVTIFIVSFFF